MWHVKVKSGTISKQSSPFHLFLSGSRSCGKSYLIETVFHAVSKAFFCRSSDPDKLVCTYQIEVSFFHWMMQIMKKLSNRYSEVAIIIIDEISMVSSKLFYQTSKCVNEIFSPGQNIPFGGKSVLVCGDLCTTSSCKACIYL